MRRPSPVSLLIAALLALGLPACGSASQPDSTTTTATAARAKSGLGLKKVGDFDHPVYVTGAPGFPKLLFVVEQPGRVIVLKGGRRLPRPFLDPRPVVGYDGGERGLLSIAFPPDYRRSGGFYVYYNDAGGNIRIDRKSTRLNSSHMSISYAVFCLQKKNTDLST